MEEINLKTDESEAHELKIAVLGKSLVGKSALTYRFINDKFPTEHDTTIEDQYKINLTIEGIQCRLGKSNHKYIPDYVHSHILEILFIRFYC